MASVVFLRGVNVGGHRTFRPSVLAKALAALDVVSIGAAGTFVVRAAGSAASVRTAFLAELAVETELMVCTGREVIGLVEKDPFARLRRPPADGEHVTVLARRPRLRPRLPLRVPDGRDWQVEIAALDGRFALARHRRAGRANLYPNEVVEKHFGVPATTRGWPTMLKVRAALA